MSSEQKTKNDLDSAELLKFVVTETSHFFSNLVYSLETAISRGELPPITQRQKKGGPPKVKRKPTAYNIFVQKKIEQMRAAGGQDHSAAFTQAATAWKNLSEEQKKAYTAIFVQNSSAPELDILPEPGEAAATPAAVPASIEQKKRKKGGEDGERAKEAPREASKEATLGNGQEVVKKKKKKKKHHDQERP